MENDPISRQAAYEVLTEYYHHTQETQHEALREALSRVPPAQPESAKDTNVPINDYIRRQAAIDTLRMDISIIPFAKAREYVRATIEEIYNRLEALPSVQPTLYGYNIEHLYLIARVLQKENLPPERVVEALADIGRIVEIVRDEFEESLRKAVEQCMTT